MKLKKKKKKIMELEFHSRNLNLNSFQIEFQKQGHRPKQTFTLKLDFEKIEFQNKDILLDF